MQASSYGVAVLIIVSEGKAVKCSTRVIGTVTVNIEIALHYQISSTDSVSRTVVSGCC